jgi:hypothetical protein
MARPPRRNLNNLGSSRVAGRVLSDSNTTALPKRMESRQQSSAVSKQLQTRGSSLVLTSDVIDVSTQPKVKELPGSRRSTRTSSIIVASEEVSQPQPQPSRKRVARSRLAESSPTPPPSRKTSGNASNARERQRTPSVQPSLDSDLYGLSPEGEISRAKIEAATGSKRTSLVRPTSALKVRGTPGLEKSILAPHNIKRRARKPSIMQSMVNTAQNSEVEDNLDFSFDLPSDEFAPVDESTPLNKKRTRNSIEKRASIEITTSSSGRKRKFDEIVSQHVQTHISVSSLSSPPRSSPPPVTIATSEESSLPETHIARTFETHDAEPVSEVTTPSIPSSSEHLSPPPVPMTAKQEGNARKRLRAFSASTKLVTELLGQRSTRHTIIKPAKNTPRDILDLPDSSESSVLENDDTPVSSIEDVEETAPTMKRSTRSGVATTAQKKKKAPIKSTTASHKTATKPRASVLAESKSKGNIRRTDRQNSKTANKGKVPAKASSRKYGSRSTLLENQENAIEDDSFQPILDESTVLELNAARNKVLAKMRNKFAEVDDWEMEFESVGSGESSSWR